MNDRTMIRPGGRRNRKPTSSSSTGGSDSQQSIAGYANDRPRSLLFDSGIAKKSASFERNVNLDNNKLFILLSPLILLVSKIKRNTGSLDIDELKIRVKEQIAHYRSTHFEIKEHGVGIEEISYGLCCLLDEMVLNTPWGAKSSWAKESLLVAFHRESWGGERFFDYLDAMSQNPSKYLAVIEFYYALMELGFEGKYRLQNDGLRAHQMVKNNTYLLIEKYRDLEVEPLSAHWLSDRSSSNAILKVLPQWVIWSVCFGLLALFYAYFSISLANDTDPVKRKIVALRDKGEVSFAQHEMANQPQIKPVNNLNTIYSLLVSELATEINANLLMVDLKERGVGVRLIGDDLFRSGSDQLSAHYKQLIEKIGQTLSNENVAVNVTGHSDDIPIRTLRFPDNWELSEARAEAVKQILAARLPASSQITARGLADTQNLAPNDNSENRARNRRVEILIKG